MKYVKTGDVLAVRLDPGEEIIASVLKIAKDEDIRFAEISAIGAVGRAVFADEKGAVIGGHLNEAVISATCEMFIKIFDIDMGRRISEQTGLNIFDI